MAMVLDGTGGITTNSGTLLSTSDATINGQTVGKGGGNTSTNTVHGVSTLTATNTIGDCTAVGYQALKVTTGKQNTAVGSNAGASMTSGEGLAAFGWNAANLNTADNVTALGHNTLGVNTTGANNTAVGNAALNVNTTGGNNTAVGRLALVSNTTASNNTAVGYQAGYTNVLGTNNTFIGYGAGYTSNAATTTGYNTAVGAYAGYSLTTGTRNTFIGSFQSGGTAGSGSAVTTGSANSILGAYTGGAAPISATGSNFIVLSDGDGGVKQFWHSNGYWEYVNNTQLRLPSTGGTGYIGYLADSSSIQVSYNSVGNGVRLTSGATSWSTWSDQRLKNITGTYTTPLADISQLQPIKFTWKSDEENKPQVGILAQSVQPVVPEAVEEGTISLEDETKYLTVRYTELIPLMVASIKELKTIVDAQAAEIAELKAKVM